VKKIEADIDPYSYGFARNKGFWLWVCIYSGHMTSPFKTVDEFLGEFGYLGISDIYIAVKTVNS